MRAREVQVARLSFQISLKRYIDIHVLTGKSFTAFISFLVALACEIETKQKLDPIGIFPSVEHLIVRSLTRSRQQYSLNNTFGQ